MIYILHMKFAEFIRLNEVAPMGGMPMPPPGGGLGGPPMPPPAGGMGPASLPPPGGGLGGPPMPPPGGAPMPGAPGQPGQQPTEIKTKDVWELLEKLLSGETSADQKKGEAEKPKPSILRSV